MANWINDPQEREEIEKVTQELKLPIFKANAKGKFRIWLTEVWGKIEDYLINLKNIVNEKEPIITKKTGFNLDKTDLTENNSNKLFTAKGALGLFNNLTTAISTAVEAAKTALRADIVKKIDKTSISDSLTSTSQTTVLSSAGAKILEDKKLNIIDSWKYIPRYIGNVNAETDLNTIMEPGEYANIQNINKFKNTPSDYKNIAFNLTVETINLASNTYRTQILKSFTDSRTYKRTFINESNIGWSAWVRIDAPSVNWGNLPNKPSDFPPSSHTHDDRYFTEAEVNAKFTTKHLEIVGKDYGGILNTAGTKVAGKTYFDNNTKKLFLCKNNNSDTSANVANYIALDNNSILERLENLISVNNAFKNIKIYSGTASNVNQTQRVNLNIAGTPIFVGLSIVNSGYREGNKSDYAHYYNLSNTGFNIRCGSDFRETINWIILSIV